MFNPTATTEAAAYLLRKAGDTLNFTAMLKMLYLADRKSMQRWGISITGAQPVSMSKGPVLSEVYDLLKGDARVKGFELWAKHIRRDGYNASLLMEAPNDELSGAALSVLDETFAQFGHRTYGWLINYCHDLPEWTDPGRSSVPIDMAAMLRAVGKDEETVAATSEDAAYYATALAMLRPV